MYLMVYKDQKRRFWKTSSERNSHSMKAITNLLLAGLLVAVLATNARAENPPSDPPATAASPATSAVTAADIQALKDALAAQQLQIQALQAQLQSKNPPAQTGQTAPPVQSAVADVSLAPPPGPQNQTSQSSDQNNSGQPQVAARAQSVQAGSSDERIRNLERQIKGLGPINFSGDVRLRAEPFFGGPADQSLDQARGRVRVRFNAFADLGTQFRTGITLASGDINDPTTTNQTFTGFYTRKAVALDQAFVEFTPKQFKSLTVVGGKFRYPWYNTELTWDKDLNPEGAAQTLGFKLDTPVLKRVAFIGFELPFAQIAGTASTNKSISQQITSGGQLQTSWQLVPRVTLNAYSGYYDFQGADSIALALARASSKNPQTPLTGLLPLGVGNPVQDSTYTTTSTTVVTVGGVAYPTGVTSITNAQFASKFMLFDNIARFDIDTGNARFPLSFIGDYVQNAGACDNLANILAAPANTSSQTYK